MKEVVVRLPFPVLFACRNGRWVCLFLLSAALLGSGCSRSSSGPANSVSGKVTLRDKPVSGIVVFVYPDGQEVSAPTNAEGTYTIPNPTTGSVKVLVRAMPGTPVAPAKDTVMPKDVASPNMGGGGPTQGVSPPAKYGQLANTPLSFEVTTGKQTHDIPLTP